MLSYDSHEHDENVWQYKSRFSLIVEETLASIQALPWLGKKRICLKISGKLHNDVLRYW